MDCRVFTQAGHSHRSRGAPNEDHATALKNDELAVIAVCDGAGSRKAGGIAARLVSQAVADELFRRFQELYFSDGESVRRRITQLVEGCLTAYSQTTDTPAQTLATTILAAALDTQGRCLCVHLGDGIILRQKAGRRSLDVVSSPRNGLVKNTTYLTMNCDMWRHMGCCRWKDPALTRLMLLTDGAAGHLVKQSKQDGWVFRPAIPTELPQLKAYLDHRHPRDDYTCGMITRICTKPK